MNEVEPPDRSGKTTTQYQERVSRRYASDGNSRRDISVSYENLLEIYCSLHSSWDKGTIISNGATQTMHFTSNGCTNRKYSAVVETRRTPEKKIRITFTAPSRKELDALADGLPLPRRKVA